MVLRKGKGVGGQAGNAATVERREAGRQVSHIAGQAAEAGQAGPVSSATGGQTEETSSPTNRFPPRSNGTRQTRSSEHPTRSSEHTTRSGEQTTRSGEHTTRSGEHTTRSSEHTTRSSEQTTCSGEQTTGAREQTTPPREQTTARIDKGTGFSERALGLSEQMADVMGEAPGESRDAGIAQETDDLFEEAEGDVFEDQDDVSGPARADGPERETPDDVTGGTADRASPAGRVPGETVEELVYHWSQTSPGTEAFVCVHPETGDRHALSRLQFHELARKFAAVLRHQGVAKGDAVCVALPNSLERVVADFGVICSGAVALNGQVFRADGDDMIQALNSTKARAIVLDPEAPHGAWTVLKEHVRNLDGEVESERLPHLRYIIKCRRSDDPNIDFLSKLRQFPLSLQRARALRSDVAVIWTTSGSTGYSKLVPQTHANLLHIACQVLHIAGLGGGDRFLNCAPLGWAGGFPLWFLASGATRVFLDAFRGPPPDMARAVWRCVQQEKCVYVFASPVYVAAILERRDWWQGEGGGQGQRERCWRPRGICLAGQPMKRAVVAAVGQLCDYIDINYGTTECGVIATTRVTDAATYEDGVTGPPALGVEVRIVDEKLQEVAVGQTGEVMARSPALYGAYVDNEDASRRAFTRDDWFRTDDVAYFQDDGCLVHLGRRSDVITRGAYLCYPGWLEALLRRAPGVKDVCVVPVPDPVLHHEICACVVPSHTPPSRSPSPELEESLRRFADSLLVTSPGEAQHMAPRFYVLLDAFPLTRTGKISRRDLTHIACQRLGL